jgi:hypothetical protein
LSFLENDQQQDYKNMVVTDRLELVVLYLGCLGSIIKLFLNRCVPERSSLDHASRHLYLVLSIDNVSLNDVPLTLKDYKFITIFTSLIIL